MDIMPSTKIELDIESGNNIVVCANKHGAGCRLHKNIPQCYNCPVYAAQLTRLHAFETWYQDIREIMDKESVVKNE